MRRFCLLVAVLFATTLIFGCSNRPWPNEVSYRLRHTPPNDKDIVEALMSVSRFELLDSTCRGAGPDGETGDRTVGQYISAILVKLSDPEARNDIVAFGSQNEPDGDAWNVQIMIRHAKGNDRNNWGWGIAFKIRKSDGKVDLQSLRCTGLG
jgi:hypothetical protein